MEEKYRGLFLRDEANRCLLCYDASCDKACKFKLKPSNFVRSIAFSNKECALSYVSPEKCEGCYECENACIHYERPIQISKLITECSKEENKTVGEVSLRTTFLGVECENPFFLSSSIVAGNYEMCRKALLQGWGGIVFKTIGFYKPEEVSPRFDATKRNGSKFYNFRNLEQISEHSLEENLRDLRRLKEEFPNKVIVSSIMGQNDEEWTKLASLSEEAGVDIIECNFSCPHMASHGLGSDVGANPELVKHNTECVRRGTSLPILAKMTPNVSNMEPSAIAAIQGGADGIAAINTIKSISSIDLSNMSSKPYIGGKSSVSGLSGVAVKPVALRFISDMKHHPLLKDIPISGMGGIETWQDACEFIALGSLNVQVTTSVMEYGYRVIDDLISGTKRFMITNGYQSINDFVGKAISNIVDSSDLERHTIMYPVFDRAKCVGCGRCYISCTDAGHQAIRFADNHIPKLIGDKCAGCHLCLLVCPTDSITRSKRINKVSR